MIKATIISDWVEADNGEGTSYNVPQFSLDYSRSGFSNIAPKQQVITNPPTGILEVIMTNSDFLALESDSKYTILDSEVLS